MMLEIKSPKDLTLVANFIAELNKEKEHHVGYCGIKADELLHTLDHDFSDLPIVQSFIAAYDNGVLIGVLGIDIDETTKVGELWGPFVLHAEWEEISFRMWNQLLAPLSHGALKEVKGFYNLSNSRCGQFMDRVGAKKEKDHHSILKITREDYRNKDVRTNSLNVMEYTSNYYQSFKDLHHQTFKQAYYGADEIIGKVDAENKLFIMIEGETLLGYAYCETEAQFAEGDIHFIAVSPVARNKGVGKALINRCLEFMFSFNELDEIILCVNSSNKAALSIYEQAGFIELNKLVSYELKV
ncbi:GNAT family N-acetyltransferase [Alkalihalophilus sp. As8PL]|uniref:GNAT family N-acetyltransferase n=1 Tax=Alkalihalophilus sp. As8PL TaxID=3237103 RepID=A0AB39BUT9_9BACI